MNRPVMVMVAALALLGGACGGDDDGDITDDSVLSTTDSNGAADSSNTDSSGTDSVDAVEEVGYTESDENDEGTIDDGGEVTAETVADDASDEGSADDGTLRGQTITRLIGVGLTEVQAICIVDNVPDLEEFARTGESDPTQFLVLVKPCEIDLMMLTPPTATGG